MNNPLDLLNIPEPIFLRVLDNLYWGEVLDIDRAFADEFNANQNQATRALITHRRNILREYLRRLRREPSPPPRQPKRKDDDDDDDEEPPDQKDIFMTAKRAKGTFNIPSFSSISDSSFPAYSPASLMSGFGIGNRWVQHVKAYASKHGMKYNEALKDPRCRSSYKK